MRINTGYNSTYPKVAIQLLNQALCFYQSLCLVDSEVLRNRHLRVAAKRCVQHIFRTYAESFSPIFPKEIYWNCYRKILRDNWKPNRTLSINFVLKIGFRENSLWNQNLKLSVAWKLALRENPNFANKLCVEFLSSENIMQHTTAVCFKWLLPDFPAENPLLNGMFCYICNGLVLVQRHW